MGKRIVLILIRGGDILDVPYSNRILQFLEWILQDLELTGDLPCSAVRGGGYGGSQSAFGGMAAAAEFPFSRV